MATSCGFLVVLMLLLLRAAGEAPASILPPLLLMLTMVLRAVGGAAGEPPAWILLPLVAVIRLICLLRLRRTARASAVGRRGSTMLNKMLLAVTRGVVLLCRMVPPLFIRLVLLSMAPQATHARISVILDDQEDDKTSKFEEGMKEASVVFIYIGLTYYLLPLVSFRFTADWKKVFFDCFIPLSMWLDSAHCICVLILGLFFITDIGERYAEILALFAGFMASSEAIHHYLELKLLELNQTPAHLQMTRVIAKRHVTAIFLVYLVFPPLVVLQLDKKWYVLDHIDPDGVGSKTVGIILGVTACCCEITQILHAVVHRLLPGGNWDDDETAVRLVKIAAAGCVLLSDGYDTYKKFKVQHYWKKNHCTRSSAIISAVSTGCAAVLIVGRSIGPRRGANAFIFVVKCVKAIPRVAGEVIMCVRYRVAEVLHGLQD